ncbi:MAG: FAD-binding oxidoreductase [Planctomycetota bacterium]
MSLPTLAAFADEFVPATQTELARYMADNAATRQRVIYPVGGRTALHYGCPAVEPGIAVSTAKLTNVIDYPARDMTVTVEAGIRIEALNELLKQERQRLPIDVPQAHRATLGGIIACNAGGARRYGLGTLRDYIIGISAIDAAGTVYKAGGRVVKNVAGYDLCKVLNGALGTLGLVTQVTIKLRPIPEATRWLWASFSSFKDIETVLERLLLSATRPIAMEVLDVSAAAQIAAEARTTLPANGPVLGLAFEGSAREVAWQIDTLQTELQPLGPRQLVVTPDAEADTLWNALTEFEVTAEEPLTFKANLVPSRTMEFMELAAREQISVQAHAGNGIVIGHLPDRITTAQAAAALLTPLRRFVRQYHGNIVIVNSPDAWKQEIPTWGEPEPSWPLMQNLKNQLDPQDILNRGRFIFPAPIPMERG